MIKEVLAKMFAPFSAGMSMGGSGGVGDRRTVGEVYADTWGSLPAPSVLGLIREYKNTAYTCANINSRAVAATPRHLYATTGVAESMPEAEFRGVTKQTKQWLAKQSVLAPKVDATEIVEVLDHPILTLLETVNEYLDGFALFELTDLFQELSGECYWYVEKVALVAGQPEVPVKIWIIPTQDITRVYDRTTGFYYYKHEGTGDEYDIDELICFKFPNPREPYGCGLSPLRACYETINITNQDLAYANSVMRNMGRPDLFISPDEAIGPDETGRLEKRIHRKFRRSGNGLPMVFESSMKVQNLNFSSQEMETLARKGVSKEDIANAFDVPISFLRTNDVNRANAEAGHYQHAKLGLLPRLTRLYQKLNQSFCTQFDSRLFLWFDDPVPKDSLTRAQVRGMNLRMQYSTVNEERVEEGKDPVPWGDEPLVSGAVMPLSAARKPDANAAPAADPSANAGAAPVEGDQTVKVAEDAVLNGAQIAQAVDIVSSVRDGTLHRDSGIGMLTVLFNLTSEQATTIMGSAGKPTPTTPSPNPGAANDPASVGNSQDGGPASEDPASNDPAAPANQRSIRQLDTLCAFHSGDITRTAAITGLRKSGMNWPEAFNATESLTPYVSSDEHEREEAHDESHKSTGHTRRLPEGTGLCKAAAEIFRQQRRAVLSRIKGHGLSFAKALEDVEYDLSSWDEDFAKAVRPYVEVQFDKGIEETKAKVIKRRPKAKNRLKDFNVTKPRIKEAINNLALKFCRETNRTTTMKLSKAIAKLRRDLASALTGPRNTPRELTKIVSAIFDEAEKWRAKRIALTESSRALHAAQVATAEESGEVIAIKWLVSDDACPICKDIEANNPDGVGLNELFGKSADGGPYEDIPYPPAHPHCMCTIAEVLRPTTDADREDYDNADRPAVETALNED